MKIKITADSTCDLSPELIERYNVGIVPLHVIMTDVSYSDGIDITPQNIFDNVAATGKLPTTAAPSIEEYVEYFKPLVKQYDAVIHINISSLASSSHNNAAAAAKVYRGKVFAVDSLALSTGQGLLVLKACDLAEEGLKPKDIVGAIEDLRSNVNTSFVPDALDYLHKGGRCSLAALMGAKVLKLHPLIDMKDGQMYAKKKYMGSIERCIKNYINDLAAQYPAYDGTRCFITHSSCEPEVVAAARAQVENLFHFNEIHETVAGNVVTSHCGKGTLGVLFIYE